MLGSAILETAVGLVFIYILGSLICSTLNEWFTRFHDLRSTTLETEMLHLLGRNLAGAFNKHPLIRGAFEEGKYPHYIEPSTVGLTMVQLV